MNEDCIGIESNILLIKILFWLYWMRKYLNIEYCVKREMMRGNKASLTGSAYINGG